jgi:NAD(P)-dependent dehydrogenase (short-subunit alcohol dehydrogenase family)
MQDYVLVVGSSGSIGGSFCNCAAQKKIPVIGIDRCAGDVRLDDFFEIDAGDFSNLKAGYQEIRSQYGVPRYIFSTPGVYFRKGIVEYDDGLVWDVFKNNFLATTNIVRASLEDLTERRTCRVVLVSSVAAHFGAKDAYYAASKAAVLAFAKSVAREYSAGGLSCNAICPGPVDTKMADVMGEERKLYYAASIPKRRLVEADEVANLAAYLLFDAPDIITGAVYDIDGGLIRR